MILGLFWLVFKLEISYRVIVSWRIFVSFRGFLKIIIFAWWNIWVFKYFFFCIKILFNVNGKGTVWQTPSYITKVFSLYKMYALGHCSMMHTACNCTCQQRKVHCCCASYKHKKIGKFFQFFPKWWIFSKKCNKSQNIPNMKTKIFNYPSIVLATYRKPNSEIRRFSHFWWLKPWKNFQFQFLYFFSKKSDQKKKGWCK